MVNKKTSDDNKSSRKNVRFHNKPLLRKQLDDVSIIQYNSKEVKWVIFDITEVKPVTLDATATTAVIKYDCTTTTIYADKTEQVEVSHHQKKVSFKPNTTFEEVVRVGTIKWNDQTAEWKVTLRAAIDKSYDLYYGIIPSFISKCNKSKTLDENEWENWVNTDGVIYKSINVSMIERAIKEKHLIGVKNITENTSYKINLKNKNSTSNNDVFLIALLKEDVEGEIKGYQVTSPFITEFYGNTKGENGERTISFDGKKYKLYGEYYINGCIGDEPLIRRIIYVK